MNKKLAIIQSENIEIIEAIKIYFENKDVQIVYFKDLNDIDTDFDLIALTGFKTYLKHYKKSSQIINIHPSLLPAFAISNALQEGYTSGIKVSGISIHTVDKDKFFGKILAQYPILIGLNTHFDEYKQEIFEISKKLYPIVIECMLYDKIFDFTDLLKASCTNSCGGCNGGKCSH